MCNVGDSSLHESAPSTSQQRTFQPFSSISARWYLHSPLSRSPRHSRGKSHFCRKVKSVKNERNLIVNGLPKPVIYENDGYDWREAVRSMPQMVQVRPVTTKFGRFLKVKKDPDVDRQTVRQSYVVNLTTADASCFHCHPVICFSVQPRKQWQRRDVGQVWKVYYIRRLVPPIKQPIGYSTILRLHIVSSVLTTWELHVMRWPLRQAPVRRERAQNKSPGSLNLFWVQSRELRRLWTSLQLHHFPRKEGNTWKESE